jgi:flagellar biosynthetic protein FliO
MILSKLPQFLNRRIKRLPLWAWGVAGVASLAAIFMALSGNAPQSQAGDAPGSSALDSAGFAFDVFVKLCLVLGLIYICMYFLRRWQGRLRNLSTHQLAVLESVHLSQRQAIHLVRVGERIFLVGGTDQNIALLSEVGQLQEETQETTPEISLASAENAPVSFSNLFHNLLAK